jgi:hypothetical protein
MARVIPNIFDIPAAGQAVEWGDAVISINFADYPSQDLLVDQTFSVWTAAHTAGANSPGPFDLDGSTGLRIKADDGTNWTGAGDWTAPYVYASLEDLIGPYGRYDWISMILEVGWSDTTADGTITDMGLNYAAADPQQNRAEVRQNIVAAYGGGAGRTYGGTQQFANQAAAYAAAGTVLELQNRGGIIVPYRGVAWPTAPGQLTEILPAGGAGEARFPMEYRLPDQDFRYDPATDVVALFTYNFSGGARTVTFKRLSIWHLPMSAVGT